MRQLLLALALLTAGISFAPAGDTRPLVTNSIAVGNEGTLNIPAPKDWKFSPTLRKGLPPYASLRSPGNSISIEISVYWDGFGKSKAKPSEADLSEIVSNACARSFELTSAEKKTILEKLQGPAVSGTFARFTDAHWTPVLKDDYPNVASGMFRSGNLWGKFNLFTNGKDGPDFKQGLQVLQSIHRQP